MVILLHVLLYHLAIHKTVPSNDEEIHWPISLPKGIHSTQCPSSCMKIKEISNFLGIVMLIGQGIL